MTKRKNNRESDEFDDTFVDDKKFSKPSAVTNEKHEDDDDEDDGGEDCDDSDFVVDTIVLDVDITGNKKCRILRFGVLEYSANGVRYASRYYCLDMNLGSSGIFDMLDDYFIGRFRFLHSSKTCQSFMTALADVEEIVRKKNGISLFELCKKVNRDTIKVLKSEDDDGTNDVLWNGYGISDEALTALESKRKSLNGMKLSYFNDELLKRFNFYKEYAKTKHFCAFCVQKNDEYVTPNIIEDPVLSLPLIVYIPKFAKMLCEKVAQAFLESDVFQGIGIDEILTDVFLLMPTAKVSDVCSLYDKKLKIKDYGGIEDCGFVTGKYKTFRFTDASLAERTEQMDSVIGFA